MKHTIWRHKKTGNFYIVLGACIIEKDHSEGVRYVCVGSDLEWIRPKEEFLDGRFTKVTLP